MLYCSIHDFNHPRVIRLIGKTNYNSLFGPEQSGLLIELEHNYSK